MKKAIFIQIFLVFIFIIPAFCKEDTPETANSVVNTLHNDFGLFSSNEILKLSLRFDITYFRKKKPKEENVNVSFPVEVGYTLNLANKRSTSTLDINIFARYEYGFTEIFKDPATGSSNISLFQIGLSMPFIKTPEELANAKN